jgi:SAM-dependent methyltransferase
VSDTFLDGRVRVVQPDSGFRAGLDAVMLAACVPAQSGQAALELGSGVGTASLCLAARVPQLVLTGVEIDAGLAKLAQGNAAANGADARFVAADIFALPSDLKRDFDQVFCSWRGAGIAGFCPRHRPDGLRPVVRLVETWAATHCFRWIFHRHPARRQAE